MNRKGFTMIELLVVIAITALLSGISIIYSHEGQSQISLSIESSKIAQLILEAKELSIATYSRNNGTCAYGVQLDYTNQEYSLFAYNSKGAGAFCPSLASTTAPGGINPDDIQEYTSGSWHVPIAQGVEMVNGGAASDTVQDVLFFPPDPFTLVSLDGTTFLASFTPTPAPATANIYLQTVDGSLGRVITVNPAGQVDL